MLQSTSGRYAEGVKFCSGCDTTKPLTEFHRRSDRPIGRQARCKICSITRRVGWRRAAKHGISPAEYRRMVMNQCGTCSICGHPESAQNRQLNVDHDHQTGRVRGLLCSRCNTALGLLQDSPAILEAALSYLRRKD